MKNQFTRRDFISAGGAGAASLVLAPLLAQTARAAQGMPAFGRGFGPLSPKLPLNTATLPANLQNVALLSLPEGFEYTAISCVGQTLTDGTPVPGAHDGMAAYRGGAGTTILVRNHELSSSGQAVLVAGGTPYDTARRGGTTTLVLGPEGELLQDYGSLAGTERNCAGGLTPWGSWLTCEETFSTSSTGKKHGYVFEVPSTHAVLNPEPIVAMGRFNHEAAAVDPVTGHVYETEDRGDSLFYRYIPTVPGQLALGGTLWAMRIQDMPGVHTVTGFKSQLNKPLAVDWIQIEAPDPATDTVRVEGRNKGAARFSRGEGAWYGNGFVYFVCSDGGDARRGQVFAYDPKAETVTLVFEAVLASDLGYQDPSWDAASVAANGGFVHAAPDNITVGPDGRLYLCEDGSGVEKVVGVNHGR
jgi:secreted PhoX family phosphatase